MKFKELRLAHGLTQVQVAKKLGIDQAAVSNWERGVSKPCKKHLKKLSKLYGVTVEELSS